MNWLGANKKKVKKINFVKVIAMICGIAIVFILGNVSARFGIFIGPDGNKYSSAVNAADAIDGYEGIFEARDILMKTYNGDINDEMLVSGALKGMAESLEDPYTLYMTKDEYDKYLLSNEGIYVGIGISVSQKDNQIVVVNVEEGKSANRAGISVGDIILKIDNTEVGNSLAEVAKLLQGEEGQACKLTMQKSNGEKYDADVVREKIKTDSASSDMLDNNIGYIRLKNFNEGASDQFVSCLNSLLDSGAKGLIIDLRDNRGGFLTQAEGIASQFIPKGKVITTLKDKYDNEKVSKSKGGIAENIPLVILTNGTTASASEVVTGALKDYGIAETVGTTTYGKGVAQAPYVLDSTGGALKITIQKFYTPNGESIHKVGIKPDYEIDESVNNLDTDSYNKNDDAQFKKALEVIQDKIK
ncbi:MAG: S41 family peptidase [Clostridiaceae bacterium]|nr:S41 family peptidase [Clostridiaceae bacterium]